METFKDLKKKDKVKYDALDWNRERITGEGEIYGFGKFGQTDIIWVIEENGHLHGMNYEDVKKV